MGVLFFCLFFSSSFRKFTRKFRCPRKFLFFPPSSFLDFGQLPQKNGCPRKAPGFLTGVLKIKMGVLFLFQFFFKMDNDQEIKWVSFSFLLVFLMTGNKNGCPFFCPFLDVLAGVLKIKMGVLFLFSTAYQPPPGP